MDSSYYAVIPASVMYDNDLKPSEKLLYAAITMLCGSTGECWASNAYFAKQFNASLSSISHWLGTLSSKGYIEVIMRYEYGTKRIEKRIIKLPNVIVPENRFTPSQEFASLAKNCEENNYISLNTNNIPYTLITDTTYGTLDNLVKEQKEQLDTQCIKEIVDYLNSKAGTKYRHSTTNTQKHIRARLAEKYTVDDFKTVIDKKVIEWKGTDMERYLCPDTLFGTKFEKYLNQTIRQPQNKPMLDSKWTGGIGN